MPNGVDRRTFPRANYPCLIVVRRSTPPEAIMTHTENISIGGLRVMIKKKFGVATPVELLIDLMDTQGEIHCRGQISWVKEVRLKHQEASEALKYDTGIKFTEIDKPSEARINRVVERLLSKSKKQS